VLEWVREAMKAAPSEATAGGRATQVGSVVFPANCTSSCTSSGTHCTSAVVCSAYLKDLDFKSFMRPDDVAHLVLLNEKNNGADTAEKNSRS